MRNLLLLLLISTSLASCDEDFLSQTLEIDPPEYDKQLVMHGFGTHPDSSFNVYLTRNFGILENVPDTAWAIPNGLVELYEEGQKKATLGYVPGINGRYVVPTQAGLFQPGKRYELRAEAPGFDAVSAQQVMPYPVQVDSVRFRPSAGLDADGTKLSAVDVFLKDEPGVEHFYEIRVVILYPIIEFHYDGQGNQIIDTVGYQEYTIEPIDSDDPNAELTFGGGIAVSDRFFDGKSYRFSARIYNYANTGYRFKVRVRSVTEEYFLWGISAQRKYDTEDFPFADPVTTYTNLDKGIGLFGLGNEQVFVVE